MVALDPRAQPHDLAAPAGLVCCREVRPRGEHLRIQRLGQSLRQALGGGRQAIAFEQAGQQVLPAEVEAEPAPGRQQPARGRIGVVPPAQRLAALVTGARDRPGRRQEQVRRPRRHPAADDEGVLLALAAEHVGPVGAEVCDGLGHDLLRPVQTHADDHEPVALVAVELAFQVFDVYRRPGVRRAPEVDQHAPAEEVRGEDDLAFSVEPGQPRLQPPAEAGRVPAESPDERHDARLIGMFVRELGHEALGQPAAPPDVRDVDGPLEHRHRRARFRIATDHLQEQRVGPFVVLSLRQRLLRHDGVGLRLRRLRRVGGKDAIRYRPDASQQVRIDADPGQAHRRVQHQVPGDVQIRRVRILAFGRGAFPENGPVAPFLVCDAQRRVRADHLGLHPAEVRLRDAWRGGQGAGDRTGLGRSRAGGAGPVPAAGLPRSGGRTGTKEGKPQRRRPDRLAHATASCRVARPPTEHDRPPNRTSIVTRCHSVLLRHAGPRARRPAGRAPAAMPARYRWYAGTKP